ncbi:MAG: terpene cyclase/mutase family protein [Planctomycetes bacterium]|nr:terpene cyclase/mutase family protein [Planctomycetota bacterium]
MHTKRLLLCLVPLSIGALALAAPVERVARKRTLPGQVAKLNEAGSNDAAGLVLTDLTGYVKNLAEDTAPAPEKLTRVSVNLSAKGLEGGLETTADAAWRGIQFPKDQRYSPGNRGLDLNEVRIKVLLRDKSGRPTRTAGPGTQVLLKTGAKVHPTFDALAKAIAQWPANTPLILDIRGGVPARHALTVLAIVCNSGRTFTIAAPEFRWPPTKIGRTRGASPSPTPGTRRLTPLSGLRAALEKAVKVAPKDKDRLPLVGVRIRPDARCSWRTIQAVFSQAIRKQISRVTLVANAGELEIDLFQPAAKVAISKREVVITKREVAPQEYDKKLRRDMHKTPRIGKREVIEKPIIIMEEEVEVVPDKPKGTDFSHLGKGELDSTSVNDAYGVGGGAAGSYGQRWGKKSLTQEGGSAGTEAGVSKGLAWLKKHQSSNGRWKVTLDDCKTCGKNAPGDARYDVGVTSLAILAYVGNGHTHRFGKHKRVVGRALAWLKRQQNADGAIGFTGNEGEAIYNHALATQALCELFAVSRDFTLKRYAEKAVSWIVKARNPGFGWKYGVRSGRNDTSVTGAMLLTLLTAREAGINVPGESFEGASKWLARATNASGETGYQSPGGGSSYLPASDGKFDPLPVNTAIAVFARLLEGDAREDLRKSSAHLDQNLPTWDKNGRKVNFYYWYYGTNAKFQIGGPTWKAWNKAIQKALLPNQETKGCAAGSWKPQGEWCLAGGRVYATAINTLTLEVYYRYARKK